MAYTIKPNTIAKFKKVPSYASYSKNGRTLNIHCLEKIHKHEVQNIELELILLEIGQKLPQ